MGFFMVMPRKLLPFFPEKQESYYGLIGLLSTNAIYFRTLVRFINARLRNEQEANEIAQEATSKCCSSTAVLPWPVTEKSLKFRFRQVSRQALPGAQHTVV